MTTNHNKKKLNLIDLIVVIAIIAVVFSLGYYVLFGGAGNRAVVNSTVRYTFEAKEMEEDVLSYIHEGQTICDATTKQKLGTIVSIHEKPSVALAENHEKRSIQLVEYPGKIDLVLEVEAKAKMEYPNIVVDDTSLKIGKKLHCIIGDAAMSGTVIELDYDTSLLTNKEEIK